LKVSLAVDIWDMHRIGRAVIDFSGEEHGKASLLKVIGNVFILNMIETVAEGHVLAEKTGLGHANLQKFISAIFPGPFFLYSKRMVSGDYYNREEVCLPSPKNRIYY
jgi:3-hydroxyisobutyrate dehydrogenase-like beta-hydroxyacid dehydrogenase